jgi:hypothetical protein
VDPRRLGRARGTWPIEAPGRTGALVSVVSSLPRIPRSQARPGHRVSGRSAPLTSASQRAPPPPPPWALSPPWASVGWPAASPVEADPRGWPPGIGSGESAARMAWAPPVAPGAAGLRTGWGASPDLPSGPSWPPWTPTANGRPRGTTSTPTTNRAWGYRRFDTCLVARCEAGAGRSVRGSRQPRARQRSADRRGAPPRPPPCRMRPSSRPRGRPSRTRSADHPALSPPAGRHDTISSFGMATTRRAPQALVWASWRPISSRRFQGMMRITSARGCDGDGADWVTDPPRAALGPDHSGASRPGRCPGPAGDPRNGAS